MAEASDIEWCDSTFNPWVGCTRISEACDYCYAADWAKRTGQEDLWQGNRRRTKTWNEPRKWDRQADTFEEEHGRPRRVFCASLADIFDNQIPTLWRDDFWGLIRECDRLVFLLLTKRPMNIEKMLPAFWDEIKSRVWLGTTCEHQEAADRNVPHLLKHDAAVRFVSYEPALGPVKFTPWLHDDGCRDTPSAGSCYCGFEEFRIDWIVAGGESGPNARPAHPDWFRSVRDQCAAAGIPFLFKQWGEWMPVATIGPGPRLKIKDHRYLDGGTVVRWVGKKYAGRLLDGVLHDAYPEPR
ncbi:Phage protein Gp37/Gp68 [Methyloligella halotolerans]|uniref:Phage protein Gp37/Gp68 n=1 Tax=Methyloligella halotolerans TaxID=1177755 RepID=A0A1E2RZJ6_9HYPH|nr:phage Gp37/Gp68 family protein [Methyloligella halotolerans]ODA67631.1 Phage protein Gp37/Gp68 [Methyloligella halotolerans]